MLAMLTDGLKWELSLEFRMDNTLLAHLENVCLMIGLDHDNMRGSDNKRSCPCVLPIIDAARHHLKAGPAVGARKGHISQNRLGACGQWENMESL